MTAQTAIRQMTNRIARRFKPDKIVLFGSHARGTAGPDSDVDLLVIMPMNGSRRKVQLDIRCAIHNINVSKDIVVVTPDEVARQRHLAGTIVRPAMQEGQVLYEKPR